MNTSLVTALQGAVATGKVMFGASQYQNWNSIGATATRDTVTVLGQLLQRILQNGPVLQSLSFWATRLKHTSERKTVFVGNGDKYEGQMDESGLYHGFGKYTGENWTYVGEWNRGKFEGYGQMTSRKCEGNCGETMHELEFEGTFQDHRRHGYGKTIYCDGGIMRGNLNLTYVMAMERGLFRMVHIMKENTKII